MKQLLRRLIGSKAITPTGQDFSVRYQHDCSNINWQQLFERLVDDDLDNGRSVSELEMSFVNSEHVIFAVGNEAEAVVGETVVGDAIVGMARALSDNVCNAYIVDVWTDSRYRNRGIGSRLVNELCEKVSGQHVYLYTENAQSFYQRLGFQRYGSGYAKISGNWLNRE